MDLWRDSIICDYHIKVTFQSIINSTKYSILIKNAGYLLTKFVP